MTKAKAKSPQAVIEGTSVAKDAEEPAEGAQRNTQTEKNQARANDASAQTDNSGRFQDATIGFIEGLGRRAWAYADAHPHATLYSAIGFIAAVLILVVGLWRTIVIAIFVGVGAALGQARDGEGGIHNFFNRIFGGKQ